jgi:putative oxidoreductase
MNQLDKYRTHILGLFRIVVGFLFAIHGIATIFNVLGGPMGGGPSPSVGTWPGWWAAAIQLVCGVLVLVGIVTRPAAMICSGSMAFAYFTKHQPHALLPIQNNGEPAVMFCWAFLLIMFLGSGNWALDSIVEKLRGDASVPASERLTTASRR